MIFTICHLLFGLLLNINISVAILNFVALFRDTFLGFSSYIKTLPYLFLRG